MDKDCDVAKIFFKDEWLTVQYFFMLPIQPLFISQHSGRLESNSATAHENVLSCWNVLTCSQNCVCALKCVGN